MDIISTEKAPGAIGPYSQGFEVNGLVYTSGNRSTGRTELQERGRHPGSSGQRF